MGVHRPYAVIRVQIDSAESQLPHTINYCVWIGLFYSAESLLFGHRPSHLGLRKIDGLCFVICSIAQTYNIAFVKNTIASTVAHLTI